MLQDLLVGVVGGVATGVAVSYFLAYHWRPVVTRHAWIETPFIPDRQMSGHADPIGRLYKFRFLLEGRASPEWGSLEIIWTDAEGVRRRVFAKWDETAMPLDSHRMEEFRPERVPSTYFQPLIVDRVYDVPVLFSGHETNTIDIFSGWWFGRRLGYKTYGLGLAPATTEIWLRLIGANGLREEFGPLKPAEIIANSEPAADARTAADQAEMRQSLMRRARRRIRVGTGR